jgi:hypothetical protein
MKSLINSALFGLVPAPPMPNISAPDDGDDRPVVDEDVQPSQSERLSPKSTERLATEEELARLRRELGISVGSLDER